MESAIIAPLLYAAISLEREHEAGKRVWLRRLRAIQRSERRAERERKVIVSKPAHLAGVHRL
jgi:hypothetical protein